MKRGELSIKLESDLCPSSGDGFAGVVDTDICYNEYGLPYLPAKRIKGCLREAALDIITYKPHLLPTFIQLFGLPGGQSLGCLHIDNGYLRDEKELIDGLKRDKDLPWQLVLDHYTYKRSTTAVDRNGCALKQTLRSTRVLRKREGSTFFFSIEIQGLSEIENAAACSLLTDAVRGFRHMGSNRTRGLGEVKCSLTWIRTESDEDEKVADASIEEHNEARKENVSIEKVCTTDLVYSEITLESSKKDDSESEVENNENASAAGLASGDIISEKGNSRIQLRYRLHTLSPVLISNRRGEYTRCEKFIPGSTILGSFASLWLRHNNCKPEEAHKNKMFASLFLREEVIFGAALPADGKTIFHACPLSLAVDKEKSFLYDLADDVTGDSIGAKQLKAFQSYISIDGNRAIYCEPKTELALHHSRPSDKGIGRSLGTSDDLGQLFTYESLSKDQCFEGVIEATISQAKELIRLLAKSNGKLRLGRSRTAQYGAVFMEWSYERASDIERSEEGSRNIGNISSIGSFGLENHCQSDDQCQWLNRISAPEQITLEKNDRAMLYIRTPMILPSTSLNCFIKSLGGHFSVEQLFIRHTVVSGYNAKWNLPRQQQEALEMGSALLLKYNGDEPITLSKNSCFGLRKQEGWGHYEIEKRSLSPQACYGLESKDPANERARVQPSELDNKMSEFEKQTSELGKQPCEFDKESRELGKQAIETDRFCAPTANTAYEDLRRQILQKQWQDKLEALGWQRADQQTRLNNSLGWRILDALNNSKDYAGFSKAILDIKDDKRCRQAIELCTAEEAKYTTRLDWAAQLPAWLSKAVGKWDRQNFLQMPHNTRAGLIEATALEKGELFSFEDYKHCMKACLMQMRKRRGEGENEDRHSV